MCFTRFYTFLMCAFSKFEMCLYQIINICLSFFAWLATLTFLQFWSILQVVHENGLIAALLSRWSQSPSSFATLDDNFPIVFLSSVGRLRRWSSLTWKTMENSNLRVAPSGWLPRSLQFALSMLIARDTLDKGPPRPECSPIAYPF